jgi:hypothetical protein
VKIVKERLDSHIHVDTRMNISDYVKITNQVLNPPTSVLLPLQSQLQNILSKACPARNRHRKETTP